MLQQDGINYTLRCTCRLLHLYNKFIFKLLLEIIDVVRLCVFRLTQFEIMRWMTKRLNKKFALM